MTRTPMLRRLLTSAGTVLAALLVLAGLLYTFGGMWPPSEAARVAYAAEVAAGREPAIADRFTLPIPGCVCHSADPVQQMRHSTRRMSECAGCHSRR
jgi:hypothetical protein